MEPKYATEVQLNTEIITTHYQREQIIWALTLVCLAAGGKFLHAVLVAPDRIVVQAPRGSMEAAAQAICPDRITAHEIAFFDPKI